MYVGVLVQITNKSVDKVFDYFVPLSLEKKIAVGKRVTVPFNNKVLEGFIIEIKNSTSLREVKEIIAVVDEKVVLNEELLELGKYLHKSTLSSLISCYQTMLPKALKAKNGFNLAKKYKKVIVLAKEIAEVINYKGSKPQLEILKIVLKDKEVRKEYLQQISLSSLNTLLKKGILKEVNYDSYRLELKQIPLKEKYPLTDDQKKVVDVVLNNSNSYQPYLLYGVTGSGKTEVYMELIERVINKGSKAIVLVPEISLTPQIIERFLARFGNIIAVLHSRLSDGEKYDEWRRIKNGDKQIVIGARSAIFAPLNNIGIIIIDEEHTGTYKQENNPRYSAKDVALERAKYHNCPLIMGSATPTIESFTKAKKGIYQLLVLNKRINNNKMPLVTIVDNHENLKNRNGYFSQTLIESINSCLAKNEQIILFLNRRGYSSIITCRNCGYIEKCPNCDIALTYHKTSNTLRCHYCGYGTNRKNLCPSCKNEAFNDLGIGTEKIEEEIKRIFNARVVRMDFDTTSKKGEHERIINSFAKHEYDILLGTQMIAKGLDFANVTLVGVINADTSLNIPDFRSSEYTFQLLDQVSGRSGRGSKEGRVIIQTFNKDHYAIKYAKEHDYLGFYKEEMSIRYKLKYPPFFYLTSIRISSSDYDVLVKEVNSIGMYLKRELNTSTILGPTPCSMFRVNNVYRFSIIIKYKKEDKLYLSLNNLIEHYKMNNKVKVDIEFNPIHFD